MIPWTLGRVELWRWGMVRWWWVLSNIVYIVAEVARRWAVNVYECGYRFLQ